MDMKRTFLVIRNINLLFIIRKSKKLWVSRPRSAKLNSFHFSILAEYTSNVFRGIIKDLRINGGLVSLRGTEIVRNAEVRDCNSPEVQEFTNDLLGKTGRTAI